MFLIEAEANHTNFILVRPTYSVIFLHTKSVWTDVELQKEITK